MIVYVQDSLTKRGKTSWRISYHAVFPDLSTGETEWKTLTGCASKQDAKVKAATYLAQLILAHGSPASPSRIGRGGALPTVGALHSTAVGNLRITRSIEESTYRCYAGCTKRMGWLADMPADEVTASDVSLLVSQLGELYAPSTVAATLKEVKRAFNYAIGEGLTDRNPAALVKPPKQTDGAPQSLSDDEKMRLLFIAGHLVGVLPVAVYLALATGMRKGEVCGLRWSAIDFEEGFIDVVCAIGLGDDGKCRGKNPKSPASFRRLPMEPGLAPVLRRRKDEQMRQCEKAGAEFSEDFYVLGGIDGSFLLPSTLHTLFVGLADAFGIAGGKCRFHWLRHTFATSLIAGGVDVRTVAAWLGHVDPGFTLRTYAHKNESALLASLDVVSSGVRVPDDYAAMFSKGMLLSSRRPQSRRRKQAASQMRNCENAKGRIIAFEDIGKSRASDGIPAQPKGV
ncbi:site-specific integrase [Gordonibacter pamelaeae]|uniref:tyrosine-type recombinase/integrase n=1 Tax=Gordonibacter pamelaeae TaxID=471189 RepID=UPI0021098ECF|nr:site-specific integrase [Gordonibacter pamelaeae]MCQ4848378.1 site-specific integrase [Gordonibacter pamelaeae]MCQ4850803.1 site-specific integrase [Gordonibacter pamelaeae]